MSHPPAHRQAPDAPAPDLREAARLQALARYDVLEGGSGESFGRHVRLVAQLFRVPIAWISFADDTRHWIRAGYGIDPGVQGREQVLCAQVLSEPGVFCVADARLDPCLAQNPLVSGPPGVRFHASAGLRTPDGHVIGALCIGDTAPRALLSAAEQSTLSDFADFIMNGLELRLRNVVLERESAAQVQLLRHLKSALVSEETLGAVGDLGALELPMAQLLTRATELVSAAIDVDWSGLMIVSGERAMSHSVWHGPGQEKFARLASRVVRRADHPELWEVLAAGHPVWTDDAETPGAALYDLTRAGLRSVAVVPLGEYGSSRYAMVYARLHSQGTWHPADQGLVNAVARELGHMVSRRSQQEALSQSRAQLQLALSTAPLVLWATDMEGRVTLSEGRSLTSLGTSASAAVGKSIFGLYPDDPQVGRNVRRALAGESFEETVTVAGLLLESRYQPLIGEDGLQIGTLGLSYDVTRLANAERAASRGQGEAQALLKLSEMLGGDGLLAAAGASLDALHAVLEVDALALWQTVGGVGVALALSGGPGGEADLVFELALAPASAQTDVSAQTGVQWPSVQPVPGLTAADLTSPDPTSPDPTGRLQRGPVYLHGQELPPELARAGVSSVAIMPVSPEAHLALCAYRLGEPRPWSRAESYLLEAAARMMSASLAQEQQLAHLRAAALSDTLTGLSNRRAFDLDVAVDLARAGRDGTFLSLVSIDLDGLKALNDREGHLRGDELLRTFAASLRQTFRQGDRVYRLGGDEYLVLVAHPAQGVVRSVRARVQRALELTRRSGFPDAGASLGVATFPAEAREVTELLRLSDERMYLQKQAKRERQGRGQSGREQDRRAPAALILGEVGAGEPD
ncbi:diguanylate cyclase [Deinococcus sp.]|uniref:diguanylate cyclase n=1 Tax=Deinococcus sp. TaxID=47478 RepID=UPI0025CDADF4|nr:diguanylate cyclase [Deinococcus sp.]